MQTKLDALKAELLGRFEVRKTVKQKAAFAQWACDYAAQLGYRTDTERSGKLVDTRNIVFGDLSKARTLITAHYDTCARLPFPNFMTPQCWPVIILTQLLLPVILFLAIGFCVGFGARMLVNMLGVSKGAGLLATLLIGYAALGGIIWLMLFGPANPHTANDNTSGVAAVLLLLHAFVGREDVAFVLFDNEEKGLLGASAFVKARPALQKRTFVVNLDCISDGDTLLYAGSKAGMKSDAAKRILKALEEIAPGYGKRTEHGASPGTLYPSDQMVFKRGTAFAALKGRRILYLDRIHTAKDIVFEDDNLLCIAEAIKAGLQP
ncbi:MAG: M28 family peptidase [Clostridia bacterium]|nr:M28 family peptidase [Clostridia bacterium]